MNTQRAYIAERCARDPAFRAAWAAQRPAYERARARIRQRLAARRMQEQAHETRQ